MVFQITTDDPGLQSMALSNVVNIQESYGIDNVEIEVVAYGPGLSLLTDDCIARGLDYNAGGARYNTSYIQGVGLGTLTDSLSSLKYNVFDRRLLSMPEMGKLLAGDFKDGGPDMEVTNWQLGALYYGGTYISSEMRLRPYLTLSSGEIKIEGDDFLNEMVDAILGDHYPTPDRVLKNTEKIIQAFLDVTMCDGNPPPGTMDLFVVEGGTAAMTYVFQTLKENKLLKNGDTIAIGAPIFTPYLEIPRLNDYQFVIVEVTASEDERWQMVLDNLGGFAGEDLPLLDEVYTSEYETAWSNRGIVNNLYNYERFYSDPEEALRVYTKQCSVGVTTKDLAIMGATLANGGVTPKTGQPMIDEAYVPKLLAISRIVEQPATYGIALHPVDTNPDFAIVETGGQLDIAVAAAAVVESVEHLFQPERPFAAGGTFAAGFVLSKLNKESCHINHAYSVINNYHTTRTHNRTSLGKRLIINRSIEIF